ncbi:S66 peptidase family protein [Nocardia amamiensis]|uniref:S66 peptidase family protein n=1 Tax=Nocardia amamiensis TaxID=404578 RepID=UPI0009FC0633|nr:LD-carboxypeptidase [Nocardia amamiensis]
MTRPVINPPAVTPDSRVAIVSTSSPIPADELDRLVAYFEGTGRPVTVGTHARAATGYLAGSPADRAADLMAAFADPSVDLIVPATGGKGAAQLLDLLDYDTIAANPTVFTALSDPVVLANAITARTGLVTLHGPTGFDFSRPQVNEATAESFWQIVSGPIKDIVVPGPGWRIPRGAGASFSGPVAGGHLGTIRALIGTPWMPDLTGAVLILEEVFVPWVQVDAALTHLRLAGVFDAIAGLLVAVPVDSPREDAPDASYDDLILRCVGGGFPVVTGAEFGHTPTKFALPLGLDVQLDLTGPRPVLRYLENLVTA